MGTLLTFEPPAPLLRAALRAGLGVDVGAAAAARAIRAEIAHYRAHLHEGSDEAGLAALRRASAEAMRPALPAPAACADGEALTALRRRGLRLVVVSNWDVSLHERLAETGLAELVDGAVASAEVGAAKPDPAIFAHGLALAGAGAAEACHVGDSPEADVEGALAAGLHAVLLAREGTAGAGAGGSPAAPGGAPVIRSLAELARLWS